MFILPRLWCPTRPLSSVDFSDAPNLTRAFQSTTPCASEENLSRAQRGRSSWSSTSGSPGWRSGARMRAIRERRLREVIPVGRNWRNARLSDPSYCFEWLKGADWLPDRWGVSWCWLMNLLVNSSFWHYCCSLISIEVIFVKIVTMKHGFIPFF